MLLAHRNAAGLVTKAPLVLRDVDLWSALAQVARVRIYVTITTLDPVVWRQIEPGTPNPRRRLEAVQRLNAAVVPDRRVGGADLTGHYGLGGLAGGRDRRGRGARGGSVGASALRLAPGVRDHYLRFVGAARPELLERYERAYGATNAPREYVARLEERVNRLRARYGFAGDDRRPRDLDPASRAPAAVVGRASRQQLALPLG